MLLDVGRDIVPRDLPPQVRAFHTLGELGVASRSLAHAQHGSHPPVDRGVPFRALEHRCPAVEHGTYGAGIRLAMNQNFVISLDYGMAMNKQDGDSGLYIGLNYLF